VDDDRLELALELASNAGVSLQQIEAQLPPQVREKGPLQWEWVHAVLSVLDQSVLLGDITLQQATAEVHAYLNYPAVSEAVDAILSAAFGGEGPCVIVAHSLGTVVTYRVLTALAGAVDVRALITLGSPLGLNAIRRKLPTPLAMPRRVAKWQNAYDDRDVVALLPLDQTRWDIQPSIENFNGVSNGTDNAHSISGYLNDRRVGQWVADALARQA
jgi:pimeloyl-ACP methyl ester carboxylesterase